MELSSSFVKIAEQFRIDFDQLAAETEHRGEAGMAREGALRELLARYLPKRAGVDTGFVIDATGARSKQLDIVIYDRTAATVFDIRRVKYFACETVIAVGQVKTGIRTRKMLSDALENIASVKELDRSNRDANTTRPITGAGYSMSPPFTFDPKHKHRDQILGFVFTGASLREETLAEELRRWNASHPRTVWPNIYCDHNAFLASYEANDGLTTSSMEAERLYITGEPERKNLLLLFIALLSTFVTEAHVARPNLFDYAGVGATMHRDYPLT